MLSRLPLPRFSSSAHRTTRLLCSATPVTRSTAPSSVSAPSAEGGHLYIVSIPIGHPDDLTSRAASILRSSSVIAAEDTRRAGLLLSSVVGGRPPGQRLLSCHEHNVRSRIPELLRRLSAGESVALVSDAGTPCVSDPGAELVKAAVGAGVSVVPIPGACAALAALVVSAMPLGEFTFVGFLPRSGAERKQAVDRVGRIDRTVVMYEAPHRLVGTLCALREGQCGVRAVCLAREVTKKWEEFLRFGSVEEACEWFEKGEVAPRGEFTVVLGPLQRPQIARDDINAYSNTEADLAALTEALVKEGVPVSTVARSIAAAADVPKKLVYSFASECKKSLQNKSEESGS